MVGINAKRIVAGMENILAFWDQSAMQDPTEPMGSHHRPIIRAGSDGELPISFGAGAGSRSRPNPAHQRFINLGEKPIFDIHVIPFRRQDLKEKGYQRIVIRQQNGL
jgi:hypothetical protein